MAICTQFHLDICSLDPKFQINRTKNNFAKGPKQKVAAQCCQWAKFGGAQAKQGRALATLSLVQFLSKFGYKLLVSKGNYVPIAILIKENDERLNVYERIVNTTSKDKYLVLSLNFML